MSEPYRNHPSVLVKNVGVMLIVGVIVVMSTGSYLWAVLFVALAAVSFIAWARTTMTVYEDHLVVESRIISVKTRTIQYDKVASVNEVKGVFGRIFGWTSLRININSSQNYARPEVIFVLPDDDASEIAAIIKSGRAAVDDTPDTAIEEEYVPDIQPAFSFGFLDAILFGVFGTDTVKLFAAVFWAAITVITFIFSAEFSIFSILMFVSSGLFPIIGSIIRHGNFRVYRIGNKIRQVHGMLTVYDTTFELSRVNAVCVKRSLFARMIGRCCIQAEVVGINAEQNSTTPTITMLILESQLPRAMDTLFPEFASDCEMSRQPSGYLNLIMFRTLYLTLVLAAAAFLAAYLWIRGEPDSGSALAIPVCASAAAATAVLSFVYWYLSYRIFELGEDGRFIVSTTGVIDRSTYVVHYPKVQITSTRASPRARRNGIARCTLSLLSAGGHTKIGCGFFESERLDGMADRTVAESGKKLTIINADTSVCTAD